jgi:hypothetical protein
MADNDGTLSRRDALKTTAKVAGVAAFATPVVMGVFSGSARAQSACDPALDSDAIDLLQGQPKRWNINCDKQNTFAGRYNAQRTESEIPGSGGLTAVLNFGLLGVDNFPVECSFYTITAPAGWECSATFRVEQANGSQGCGAGATEATSVPGNCTDGFPAFPDFSPPAGAGPLPYCFVPGGTPNACDSSVKLALVEWVCCPTA